MSFLEYLSGDGGWLGDWAEGGLTRDRRSGGRLEGENLLSLARGRLLVVEWCGKNSYISSHYTTDVANKSTTNKAVQKNMLVCEKPPG